MVFFCDDISSSPLTAFIAAQVAELDEEVWIRHAWNGW
jgi:hypothetical protein